ncbi:MAG: MOSC domain-containing protein [Endozoicomonas sp.]
MQVTELATYPIKSTRQITLGEALISRTGFEHDRRWLLVDLEGGFITQRQYPQLVKVTATPERGGLLLQNTGMEDLWVQQPDPNLKTPVEVSVWKDHCQAIDAGDDAAEWFSTVLDKPYRLVHQPDHAIRPVDPQFSSPSDQTSFADGFPFLLTSEASLDELNSRLSQPVTMERFRPNIVIDGLEAWAEDTWKTIQIGEVTFRVAKPCSRCVMTTIDPKTGEKTGKDPLMTLSQYRRTKMGVIFGQNLIHDQAGIIRVGDKVTVLSE